MLLLLLLLLLELLEHLELFLFLLLDAFLLGGCGGRFLLLLKGGLLLLLEGGFLLLLELDLLKQFDLLAERGGLGWRWVLRGGHRGCHLGWGELKLGCRD